MANDLLYETGYVAVTDCLIEDEEGIAVEPSKRVCFSDGFSVQNLDRSSDHPSEYAAASVGVTLGVKRMFYADEFIGFGISGLSAFGHAPEIGASVAIGSYAYEFDLSFDPISYASEIGFVAMNGIPFVATSYSMDIWTHNPWHSLSLSPLSAANSNTTAAITGLEFWDYDFEARDNRVASAELEGGNECGEYVLAVTVTAAAYHSGVDYVYVNDVVFFGDCGNSYDCELSLQTETRQVTVKATEPIKLGYVTVDGGFHEDAYAEINDIVLISGPGCDSGNCSGCGGAGGGSVNNGSVDVRVSLGDKEGEYYPGMFRVRSKLPSAAIYSPVAIEYGVDLNANVEVIHDADEAIRQVLTGEVLADVVTLSPHRYEMRFYYLEDVGDKVNGLYEPTGSPFKVWTLEDPDLGSGDNLRFRVTESVDGQDTVYDYTFVVAHDDWTLVSAGLREVGRKKAIVGGQRVETYWEATPGGDDTFRRDTVYADFPWGEEVVEEILDPLSPAGGQTTTWSYHTDEADEDNYSRVALMQQSGGYWERYEYDNLGRVIKVVSPVGNAPPGASEADSSFTALRPPQAAASAVSPPTRQTARPPFAPIKETVACRRSKARRKHPEFTNMAPLPGPSWTKEIRPASEGNSSEWSKTWRNMLGQTIRTEYPDASEILRSYNVKGQPIAETDPDGVQTLYDYNTRGERTVRAIDLNRNGVIDYAGGDRIASYDSDALNRYIERDHPGAVDVRGSAPEHVGVIVNTARTERTGEAFYAPAFGDNSTGSVELDIVVKALDPRPPERLAQKSRSVTIAQSPEVYQYDLDGNLLQDGLWNYVWDGENRLIAMETRADLPAAIPRQRLEFLYDWMSRRIRTTVKIWEPITSSFIPHTSSFFLYDGWNLIAEYDAHA